MRKPLQAKLKKDVQWYWTEEDSTFMRKLKKQVISEIPVLCLPSEKDFMILETDASDDSWGAILKCRKEEPPDKTVDNQQREDSLEPEEQNLWTKSLRTDEFLCRYTSGSFKPPELQLPLIQKKNFLLSKMVLRNLKYIWPQRNFWYAQIIKILGVPSKIN